MKVANPQREGDESAAIGGETRRVRVEISEVDGADRVACRRNIRRVKEADLRRAGVSRGDKG